ncbi:E3 ubiquitin-protein ligase ATL41-like [Cucurbita moschata]|uniref:RING-type E3 ubiquitin transferase n=1 Tax=Cucurbita moschata TaxID=3662 RepID=A0A6J1EGK8_CUCMO|nr:E3 ubiquitin-protein ligase ATL41-like [Cucurbita moschata]
MGSDDEDHHLRKFQSRHKIMISAIFSLFVVVLVILFLHFYLRYLHRRRRQSRLINLEHQISRADRQNHTAATAAATAPAPKAGLDPVLIAKLLQESIHEQADHHGEIVECSICLSNIEEKATVRILPNCKHIFHVECIDMWLFSNTTCPVCRTAVEPIVTATEDGETPTAPPLEEEQSGSRFSSFRRTMSRERSQTVQPTAPPLTEEQSSSRLSSFRRMMSRDRERSFRVHRCGEGSVRPADLERQ